MAAGDVGEKRASKIRISKSHEEFGFYSNAIPCCVCVCGGILSRKARPSVQYCGSP